LRGGVIEAALDLRPAATYAGLPSAWRRTASRGPPH